MADVVNPASRFSRNFSTRYAAFYWRRSKKKPPIMEFIASMLTFLACTTYPSWLARYPDRLFMRGMRIARSCLGSRPKVHNRNSRMADMANGSRHTQIDGRGPRIGKGILRVYVVVLVLYQTTLHWRLALGPLLSYPVS